MALDPTTLTDYTDAQLLKIVKSAMAHAAFSQTMKTDDRSITAADFDKLMKAKEDLEASTESGVTGTNVALVKFGRAV